MPRKKPVSAKRPVLTAHAEEKRAIKSGEIAKPNAITADSYQNFAAQVGIGTGNQSSTGTYGFNPITRLRTLLEWAYRGSWLVRQAVDCIADDMTRTGIKLIGKLSPKEMEAILTSFTHLRVWDIINEGIKWGRLYGGSVVVMLIDGQDMSTPLDVKTVAKGAFKGIVALDRWSLEPSLENLVTEPGPDLGKPVFYRVMSNAPALRGQTVHYSRVMRFEGCDIPWQQRLTENLWGLSVLEPFWDRLLAFDSTTLGAAQLVYKAHVRVYKVDGYRELQASGGDLKNNFFAQMVLMRQFMTNEGISVIDAKDEMVALTYSFGGLSDVLIQMGQQISGSLNIPLVRLFGQSPAGLNSTGESDLRGYYDGIMRRSETDLRSPLDRLIRVVAKSQFDRVLTDEEAAFDFNPLWELKDQEKAEVADRITTTVSNAKDAALISDRTALEELRNQSKITGIWTSITDEEIAAASDEIKPPMPEMGGDPQDPFGNAKAGGVREALPHSGGGEAEEDDSMERLPEFTNQTYHGDPTDPDNVNGLGAQTGGPEVTGIGQEDPSREVVPGGAEITGAGGGTGVPQQGNLIGRVVRKGLVGRAVRSGVVGSIGGYLGHRQRFARFVRGGVSTIVGDRAPGDAPVFDLHGLHIVVETARGERRAGRGWSVQMPADYGYIRGTSSAEGKLEALDCFIGPTLHARRAWVIDQKNPDTGAFDEHKVMMAYPSQAVALADYLAAYDRLPMERIMGVTELSIEELKDWIANGDVTSPIAEQLEAA